MASNRDYLDVDVRFLLANERTLLAWVRTSLAIEAGGVALIEVHQRLTFIGMGILILGAAVSLVGYHRYRSADRSIRAHHLPPVGTGPALQVALVVIIAVVICVAQVMFWR